MCRLINVTPIESNDHMPSPIFDFPVFETEEESDEEILDEISRLLEQERKSIQPHKEPIKVINLGSKGDRKEVKIGTSLVLDVNERMIDLLREYTDVFAWSY